MKKIICLTAALLMIFALCACDTAQTVNDDGKPKIVAVSFPEYDFARAVCGDSAELTMLIPPGGEVHGYEPTVSDIKEVSNCDLFIYTGGESDSWAEDMLNSVNRQNIKTLKTVDCVETLYNSEHDDEEHEHLDKYTFDEHVWTAPDNAAAIVKAIEAELSELDSENAQAYKSNSDSYCLELSLLDQDIRDVTENASFDTLVFGDRFPLVYFAQSYNLKYKAAFSGCSDDTEASASTVASLIDFVRANNINAVFVNELSSTSIADKIAEETQSTVMTFYSCHKVSKDDFESGKTYVDIMRRNIDVLKIALN